MKSISYFLIMFFCSHIILSQSDYPEPKKTPVRLFYIQHSNNHNTYVYDINLKNGIIDLQQPINEYQIAYAKDGAKKPLTNIQKKLAYGITLEESNSEYLKFRLAASKTLYFYLNKNSKTSDFRIFVTINNHKIYLNKMFVQLKTDYLGINAKAEYVLFWGEDFDSGKLVQEKVILE